MKFRIYQIYILLSIACLVFALINPVMQLVETGGATYELANFSLKLPDGTVSSSVVALGVVICASMLVNSFSIFVSMFSNFQLLKRISILSMLLMLGYYLLLGVYTLLLFDSISSITIKEAIIYPLFALIFNFLTFIMVRKTEAKILSLSTTFRLRN